MPALARAVVNYLLQQPSVVSTVGMDSQGPWIFANQPDATIENTGKAMIVVTVDGGWGSNGHNTANFPTIIVDVWADPTRNTDLSVRTKDADLKAELTYKALDKFLHVVNPHVNGQFIYWGTASQIATKTGVRIISSSRNNEPSYRPAINDEGAVVATVTYDASI